MGSTQVISKLRLSNPQTPAAAQEDEQRSSADEYLRSILKPPATVRVMENDWISVSKNFDLINTYFIIY